jgi:hypothetical protein
MTTTTYKVTGKDLLEYFSEKLKVNEKVYVSFKNSKEWADYFQPSDRSHNSNNAVYISIDSRDNFYFQGRLSIKDLLITEKELNDAVRAITKANTLPSNPMPELLAGKHYIKREGTGYIGLVIEGGVVLYFNRTTGDAPTCFAGWDEISSIKSRITEIYEVGLMSYVTDCPNLFSLLKDNHNIRPIWRKVDEKALAISKELELAKAKKERLEKHIQVLESKLEG